MQVNFRDAGVKWLALEYAKLEAGAEQSGALVCGQRRDSGVSARRDRKSSTAADADGKKRSVPSAMVAAATRQLLAQRPVRAREAHVDAAAFELVVQVAQRRERGDVDVR